MNGVKPECLGDGVCTNPRCERHGMKDTPVVTDEAVEAAWRSWNGMRVGTAKDRLRAALEAAAPLLGTRPQPTLDRETLKRQIIYSLQCSHLGSMPDEQIASHVLTGLDDTHRGWDAVRPLPTREQIAEAIHDAQMMHLWRTHLCSAFACVTRYSAQADAVLALFTGGKE